MAVWQNQFPATLPSQERRIEEEAKGGCDWQQQQHSARRRRNEQQSTVTVACGCIAPRIEGGGEEQWLLKGTSD